MSTNRNGSGSSGAMTGNTALQIVLIVLKLCKVIDWSWWWVLAPTWISALIVTLVFLIACVVKK